MSKTLANISKEEINQLVLDRELEGYWEDRIFDWVFIPFPKLLTSHPEYKYWKRDIKDAEMASIHEKMKDRPKYSEIVLGMKHT